MKILRPLTSVLVCLAILFAFFLSLIKVFGFEIYGVLTGSMNPEIPTGSMIYIRDAEPERLCIGDVITYSVSPGMMATHRIVDIVEDETNPALFRFQTKGDANPAVDAVLVESKKIVGKVAFSFPFFGVGGSQYSETAGNLCCDRYQSGSGCSGFPDRQRYRRKTGTTQGRTFGNPRGRTEASKSSGRSASFFAYHNTGQHFSWGSAILCMP